jgi:hypothetical protein
MPGTTARATCSVDHRWPSIASRSSAKEAIGRRRVPANEVEQDVDPAEPIDDGGDCGLGRGPVGQVADADDPAIVGEPAAAAVATSRPVSADEPEARAGLGEPVGDDAPTPPLAPVMRTTRSASGIGWAPRGLRSRHDEPTATRNR